MELKIYVKGNSVCSEIFKDLASFKCILHADFYGSEETEYDLNPAKAHECLLNC